MKRLLISLIFILAVNVTAGDLAVITVTNQTQADLATSLLGHAYSRSGERFVVLLEPEQQATLTGAGITFEVVLPDCDPEATAFIYSDRNKDTRRMIATGIAGAVELDDELTVAPVSAASAALIESRLGARWRPLADLSVPFEYNPPAVPTNFSSGAFPTDSLADLVNLDSLRGLDQRLEAFYTRHISRDSIHRARDWMVSKFQGWGYTNITTPTFYYGGTLCYNVKAVKLGYAEPDQVIVIGGHYDSYNQQSSGNIYAPGSDDDGSGTALVLEMARVLKDVPLRKTVIFMPFSAEEEGLIGSAAAASAFKAANTKLEVMMNFDMVAFTADTYWDLDVSSGPNTAYMQAEIAAAQRVANLLPVISSLGSSSDHYSFHVQGYPIIDNIESDFNTAGWHTNLDLSSRLNFPYFTEVARMAVATLAHIANAGLPTAISNLVDVGDGQSLSVTWNECTSSNNHVVYWGTSSGVYTDSAVVPAGICSYDISGLTDGTKYYVKAVQKPDDGYPSIYAVEWAETPYLIPRAPVQLATTPDSTLIGLTWRLNKEADIASYRIYRRPAGLGDYQILAQGLTSPVFADTTALPLIGYEYVVTAVDNDGHESNFSAPSLCYRATFDGGVMVADEFLYENYTLPTQVEQEAWMDTLFDQTPYGIQILDSVQYPFNRNIAARYSSVFWLDDDNFAKLLNANQANLTWYLSHRTNMLIAGTKTIQFWSTSTTVPAGHPLRDIFKVSSYSVFKWPDFAGAFGQAGWPNIEFDPTRGPIELGNVPVFTYLPGATVIYAYNSSNDEPGFEGQPCGLAYSGPEGKRIILGFPLWYMTPASAKALVQKALEYFGETNVAVVNGDIDMTGTVDVGDLTVLIDHLFLSFSPLPDPDRADVDGSCTIDVGDLTGLIAYLFLEGPAPVGGCVP